jgi:hypothetical protein
MRKATCAYTLCTCFEAARKVHLISKTYKANFCFFYIRLRLKS